MRLPRTGWWVLGFCLAGGLPPAAQTARVQVGFCGPIKDVAAAKAAGFDYIELGTTEIAGLSDAEFEQAARDIKTIGLPVPVTNLFLPGTLKVTGPAIDRDAQMAYVTKAFDRLARLGTQILVFGSGGARRVPDGFSRTEAFAQLVEFGKRIAPEAAKRGITIAIEPLRRQESNIINSAAEGLELVQAIDHPNFQLMIDFYHLASEKEDPAVIKQAGARLRHLHTANPQGRVFPLKWEEFEYGPFFAMLRATGYDRRISVEASTKDFAAEAPQSIALLRRAFTANPAGGAAAAPAPPPQTPPQGGRGGGSVGPRPNTGPSDRPIVDPAAVERGTKLYAAECVTCHGASARGTERGPSLIRSALVLSDREGKVLGPFFAKGHPMQTGRPSSEITTAQAADLMQFVRQKYHDTLRGSPLFTVGNILTGDPAAGEGYFNGEGKCTACHSVTGDLAGIGKRFAAVVDLQQRMLFPLRGRGANPSRSVVTVTITPPAGPAVSGTLVAEDDFYVTYRDASNAVRVVRRAPGTKVVKTDPLRAHQQLLDTITDKQIHDLVAYLEKLK
jgi:sugar phosphate isomerase/epimerase/cytochrome c2